MQQHPSVSEALQTLENEGYHVVETDPTQPTESIESNDWRLDAIHTVKEKGSNALFIAVSSASKRLKLVFVETAYSLSDYSPVSLLRKLFPKRKI